MKSIKKTTKTRLSTSDDSWRSEIEAVTLNDEEWSCVIGMIVETELSHSRYLELFNDSADEEKRDKVFSLSYHKLIRRVKSGGKLSSSSRNNNQSGICKYAIKIIEDEGEEAAMDAWLLCRLIKYFINLTKIRNLRIVKSRTRIERKEMAKKINTPNTTATRKSKGGSSGEVKSFDKIDTKLRKRGEEWKDVVRIDDAPLNGPNLYVVLTGFYDMKLATELLNAGLPLTAIFKVVKPGEESLMVPHPRGSCFWSNLENALKNPKTASGLSQVILQDFCPPEFNGEDLEAVNIDAYRRISFLMYDLYDLKRLHENYLKKMKLQSGLDENKPVIQDTRFYDTLMNAFPEECVSVAIILDAILCQIEGSNIPAKIDTDEKKSSETTEERLRSKIDHLNKEFDIFYPGMEDINPENSYLRLIIHGDDFGKSTYHCDSLMSCPPGFGFRVFNEFAFSSIWKNVPMLNSDQMKMHDHNIGKISDCFESFIDKSNTEHYLHILLFDKLINGKNCGKSLPNGSDDGERNISLNKIDKIRLKLNVKRTKSETIIYNPDKSTVQSLLPNTLSKSDSVIDYGKEITETFESPELFDLINTREIFGSGGPKNWENLNLEEFDAVQILPSHIFSQVFFSCFNEYRHFKTRYFSPTDSILVIFCNDNSMGENIFHSEYAESIRTPVCLRDFAKFVIFEEKDWLDKENEKYDRILADEEKKKDKVGDGKMQNMKEEDDLVSSSLYREKDFILQNTIKGREEAMKQKSHQALIDKTETELPSEPRTNKGKLKKGEETNPGKSKIFPTSKRKEKVINAPHKTGNERESFSEDNSAFSNVKKNYSDNTEPILFLGYNIADHRVQVSGSNTNFYSKDGTIVKVNFEDWIYGQRGVKINLNLLGDKLVVHYLEGDEFLAFNLTTSNGILMAFSLPLKSQKEEELHPGSRSGSGSGQSITKRNYQGSKMSRGTISDTPKGTWITEMAVDPAGFRISLPSGLIVETQTLPGDATSKTFYIKQFYLSKGPESQGISREKSRAFLKDGTIIVFLNNDIVKTMRSNGCIVTCNKFAKDNFESEKKSSFVEIKKAKRTSQNSFSEEVHDDIFKNFDHSRILEPDGKLYEIFGGTNIIETGQELVRTTSDYEVDEKFTRRSDGTNILIKADGSLATSFPDGSRITTEFVIEDDPVYCEWTEEELRKFYNPANIQDLKLSENISKEDGFVSIFLISFMEHKNYATVKYDQSKMNCSILMPGNVVVQLSSDDSISVNVNSKNFLKVGRNEVSFTGMMTENLSSSKSVFSLENIPNNFSMKESRAFFETKDSFDNIFRVDLEEGKTSYEKFDGDSIPKEYNGDYNSSSALFPTKQSRQLFQNASLKSYRLFSVKRDLSANEYLHQSERRNQESDPNSSVFFHKLNEGDPENTICTTFSIPDPVDVSKAWLHPYKVKSIRPRNEDRKDILRSTYSIPWNYLIPYGKNGCGIWDRKWNLPLVIRPDFNHPEVVVARTTERIKKGDENMVKKMQEALGCYLKKAINNFGDYRSSYSRSSQRSDTRIEKSEIKNWLRDFALGGKNRIERGLYFDGMSERLSLTKSLKSEISNKGQSRMTSGSENENVEEIEWYKTCLKNHIVPPYFVDIHGTCFTWILECVNKISERKEEKEEDEVTNYE